MKKIISISGMLMIAGISIVSSVSAESEITETTSATATGEVSTPVAEPTNMNDPKMENLYEQCLAYVNAKNLTGIDCKEKIEAMKLRFPGIVPPPAMMNQDIKMERMNQEIRKENKEIRQEVKILKQKALSEKNRVILEKAVNTFSLERLQTILTKVTKAISIAKKEKVLAQLNEIEELVQSKIDELTGTSSEDTILNDILSPTDSTETPATTATSVTQ